MTPFWSRLRKNSLHTEQLIIYFYHTLTSTEYFLIFKIDQLSITFEKTSGKTGCNSFGDANKRQTNHQCAK